MNLLSKKLALLCLTAFFPVAAGAATSTFNVTGSLVGGQLGTVMFDFTVTNDFSADIADTANGLTINSLTATNVAGNPFALTVGPIGYTYFKDVDYLRFGSLADGIWIINPTQTDFVFNIRNLKTAPIFDGGGDSLVGVPGIQFYTVASSSIVVTPVDPVPLPAALPLVLTGAATLLAARRLKRRRGARIPA